jgi:hypothetical protein
MLATLRTVRVLGEWLVSGAAHKLYMRCLPSLEHDDFDRSKKSLREVDMILPMIHHWRGIECDKIAKFVIFRALCDRRLQTMHVDVGQRGRRRKCSRLLIRL